MLYYPVSLVFFLLHINYIGGHSCIFNPLVKFFEKSNIFFSCINNNVDKLLSLVVLKITNQTDNM